MADGSELHTRIVALLKIGFPILAIGMLMSVFVLGPSEEDGAEIFFSEADVDQLGQGLQITNPTFTGKTESGDSFIFKADLVEPDAAPPTRATITRLRGEIDFGTGTTLSVSSEGGELEIPDQILDLAGSVRLATPDGHDLAADQLSINLADGVLTGRGQVRGTGPMGRITSETLEVRPSAPGSETRLFSFGNGVRLVYDPPAPAAESPKAP